MPSDPIKSFMPLQYNGTIKSDSNTNVVCYNFILLTVKLHN